MNSLKINGKTTIPLDTILRIVPLSDQDRMSITEKLENIDASQYNTRIEFQRGCASEPHQIKRASSGVFPSSYQTLFPNVMPSQATEPLCR